MCRCVYCGTILLVWANLSLRSSANSTFLQHVLSSNTNGCYKSLLLALFFCFRTVNLELFTQLIRSIDRLSTFKHQLKSHFCQSAFTVYSPCASASDSFPRFWRYINLYVCICMYGSCNDIWFQCVCDRLLITSISCLWLRWGSEHCQHRPGV